jgi:hypothetical protein
MKRKKMKLDLGKLTVVNLDPQSQENVKGGYYVTYYCTGGTYCCTVGTYCCTINVATCIPDPEGCNPADTYGAGTICP